MKQTMKKFFEDKFSRSNMTASDVLDMRRLHDDEGLNDAQLARIFNVSRKTVYDIVNRKTRNSIPDPVPAKGYKGYMVYPDGRVYSEARGEFMTPVKRSSGQAYRLRTTSGKRTTVAADALINASFSNRSTRKN